MKTVALVEDNPDNRLLVRVILEPHYTVAEYEDGASALEGMRRQVPDLVLLDISLPEMDGVEVLRRLRVDAALKQLPVVALTAHAMAGDREKHLAAGFDDYVTKPIMDENVLLDAISRRLTQAGASQVVPGRSDSVDGGALDRMLRLGGRGFAAEMIGLFLDYAERKISEGHRALAAGNLAGVKDAMHPIKSSAGNVGAMEIQRLAATIEGLAAAGERERVSHLLEEMDRAYSAARPGLEASRRSLQETGGRSL